MLKRIRLGDKCPHQEYARRYQDDRARILQDLLRKLWPDPQINAKHQMDQCRKQNVDVARAHKQTQLLGDRILVRKINTHELSGHRKSDEEKHAEDEMKPGHEFVKGQAPNYYFEVFLNQTCEVS